jgi:hypothetical protein
VSPDDRRDVYRPGTVLVRLVVWGVTEADQERAICHAGQGESRNAWEFVKTERLTGKVCPLNLNDGRSVATGAGHSWAYAVYRAGLT